MGGPRGGSRRHATIPRRVPRTDDLELLERWRDGHTASGEALFERHFESVYGFFCNKVGRDVDDLVQETFLGCVNAKDRFRAESSFRTFMFAVAHRQLLKYREKWGRARGRSAEDFEVERVHDLDRTPSQVMVEHGEQTLLLRGLRRLELDQQVLLELFYWQGLRSVDVAEILEVPHGTVRSRLRRAREQLREVVEQLAADPRLAESTLGDFEGWLRTLQRRRSEPQGPSQT